MFEKLKAQAVRPRNWLITTILLFIALAFTNGVPFVYSDGYCYYHIARSLADHGSFSAPVQPEYFDYKGHVITQFNDRYVTVCSPGTSLFLLPSTLIGSTTPDDATIYTDYFEAFNGHQLIDGVLILTTAVTAALVTLVLLYKTLINLGYSKKLSGLATLLGYGSSFAIWYVLLLPTYTHTYEMLMATIVLYSYARYKQKERMRWPLIAGLAGGLAFIIRPVAVIPSALLGVYLLLQKKFKHAGLMLAGTVPSLLLWIAYNQHSYGDPVTSGYNAIRGEHFTLSEFHFFDVLANAHHGWLVFSPIFLFGLVGLVLLWKKDRFLSIVSLASILGTALIYGFWPSWEGGGSFGSRFMIGVAPFAIIGLAEVVAVARQKITKKHIQRIFFAVIALCFLWSIMLTGMYRFTPVGKLGRYTPLSIINYHIDLISSADSAGNYMRSLFSSAAGGNSLAGIAFGLSDYVYRVDSRNYPEVTLIFLQPPVVATDTPNEVPILLDSESGFYMGVITDTSRNYSFDCSVEPCKNTDGNITFTKMDHPETLSKWEYAGLLIPEGDEVFFFYRQPNMHFKGREVYILPGEDVYRLQ